MNKTSIKNFAIWSRNKLIADVKYRAGLMGITESGIASKLPQSAGDTEFYDIGTSEPYKITGNEIRQRQRLVDVIEQKAKETDYKTAYKYILEEVAYTWFNRLIAIRFMEVNDYLPSHVRVLSSESGKTEPDLVTNPFEAELEFSQNETEQIISLKQDNRLDEVFRILFIKQCNALNDILPRLFEKTSDYTELLINISFIDQDGVVAHLVNDIDEADFDVNRGGQVEIIGWLYQYYNTEPKNEAFAKNGKITKEEIPAVTQLFTPDWIVRYMVENSLGRLWLDGHPNEVLKSTWKYYLDEAKQEPEVEAKLAEIRAEHAKINPEDIKLIDPCMGSGHILVYAFDILMQIYETAGWTQRDAARSILENNIFGLDIDDRAGQMAYFAIMMKARQYNRRILSADTPCNVYAIQESNGINRNQLQYFGDGLSESEKNNAMDQTTDLLDTFKDAKEYGSILNVDNYEWDLLRRFIGGNSSEGQMNFDTIGIDDTASDLESMINMAEIMARKYSVVITNPPYMGGSANSRLYTYIKKNYETTKSDMFAVFMEVCFRLVSSNCSVSMVTPESWMFLESFGKLREQLLEMVYVNNLLHLGTGAFEAGFGTVAFSVTKNKVENYKAQYLDIREQVKSGDVAEEGNKYTVSNTTFEKYPGKILAYWCSDNFSKIFEKNSIGDEYELESGVVTGDNVRFLKAWYEVNKKLTAWSFEECDLDNKELKWYKCNKGGGYRKWYGNYEYVIDIGNNALDIRNNIDPSIYRLRQKDNYFIEGINWPLVGLNRFSAKYTPKEVINNKAANSIHFRSEIDKNLFAYMNSKVYNELLQMINPTVNFPLVNIANSPLCKIEKSLSDIVDSCINISRDDWDDCEISWDFIKHPLTKGTTMGRLIADKYKEWEEECNARFNQLKTNEEELNRIFIDIYGLQDELTPEVEDKDVTVRKAELQRDIKSLLSYAVGCMFGRYSLDVEGLTYAGGEWDSSKYTSFIPDADNVIPITDEEYLEDDVIARLCTWLKVVYGEDTLEENLEFIAKALGNKGETSRDIIRNYFLNDFFKDHCQTYSVTGSGKRPIYWLFDSGKQNGFKALIYLHRYNPDTIGQIRVEYLHRMQRVYDAEIGRMQDMIDNSTNNREVNLASKRKDKLTKQLKECRDYDELIGHLALERINLDLDDGVKYNYRKVQTGSDGKFYEVLADSKAIMMDDKKYKDFKKN